MIHHFLATLVAIIFAIAPFLGAADEALPPDSAGLAQAGAAEESQSGLPPLDATTLRFIESPPPGFTTEEYRTAVRNLVLADVARLAQSEQFKDVDQQKIRRMVLEHIQGSGRADDKDDQQAMADLWYSRTPPERIPKLPVPPAPSTETDFSSTQLIAFFLFMAVVSIAHSAAKNRSKQSTVGNIAACFLLPLLLAGSARGAQDRQAKAIDRKTSTSYCESLRNNQYKYRADLRQSDIAYIDTTQIHETTYCREITSLELDFNNAKLRLIWGLLAWNLPICIAICVYFLRTKGVTRLESRICVAAFLALAAHGLYGLNATRAAHLALRENERAGIEFAKRTADEARLAARWQYDRQIAVADLLFEECLESEGHQK